MLLSMQEVRNQSYGGKADQLIRLNRAGITVPQSYVISYKSLLQVMEKKGLILPLGGIVKYEALVSFFDSEFDIDLFFEMYDSIQKMLETNITIRRYAVRSSHDYEDGTEYSFSGLFHTELNLKGTDQIVMAIIECWKRSFSRYLNYYCSSLCDLKWRPCSIIVQEFIMSTVAGVVFRNEKEIIVNANYGLAKAVVDGDFGCDSWVLSNKNRKIEKRVNNKSHITIPINSRVNPTYGELVQYGKLNNLFVDEYNNTDQVIYVKLTETDAITPCMSDEMVQELLDFCDKISEILGIYFYDIEWAYDGERFIALQCRPLTRTEFVETSIKVGCNGLGLVKGKAIGPIYRVNDETSAKHFPQGAILVAKRLEGGAIFAATRAVGCITESKSPLSHSAIIARELGIPAVGAIDISTLVDGQFYQIDGENGNIKKLDGVYESSKEVTNLYFSEEKYNKMVLERLISESVDGDLKKWLEYTKVEDSGRNEDLY